MRSGTRVSGWVDLGDGSALSRRTVQRRQCSDVYTVCGRSIRDLLSDDDSAVQWQLLGGLLRIEHRLDDRNV